MPRVEVVQAFGVMAWMVEMLMLMTRALAATIKLEMIPVVTNFRRWSLVVSVVISERGDRHQGVAHALTMLLGSAVVC